MRLIKNNTLNCEYKLANNKRILPKAQADESLLLTLLATYSLEEGVDDLFLGGSAFLNRF